MQVLVVNCCRVLWCFQCPHF